MVAAEAQRRNSPELFVEAFARGYQGDVFGPLLEIGQANAAIQRSLVDLQPSGPVRCHEGRAVSPVRCRVSGFIAANPRRGFSDSPPFLLLKWETTGGMHQRDTAASAESIIRLLRADTVHP